MRDIVEDGARSLMVRHQERLLREVTTSHYPQVARSLNTGAAEGQLCPGVRVDERMTWNLGSTYSLVWASCFGILGYLLPSPLQDTR